MATALEFMPSPVASVDELLSLACSLESKAARRYRDLASSMRLRDEARLAALFDFLGDIEEKHAAQIADRAAGVREVSRSELPPREIPETFDAEAAQSSLLTPYRALAIAVRNETRAFAFYSYLAATAPKEPIRKLAEELAKEELIHADLLRRERRKAYRAEHPGGARQPPAPLPQTLPVLWSLCFETETRAARYHRALAALLGPQNSADAAAFSAAARDEEDCARQAADQLGKVVPELADPAQPTITGGRRLLEEAFERYSDIAGRSQEEAVMEQALSLAERASRRLFETSLALANRRASLPT